MKNLQERIEAVRNDREHGSRWLVGETIAILEELASAPDSSPEERLAQVRAAGEELLQARPAMAAIAGAVRRILQASGGPAGMALEAARLREEYERAPQAIIAHARPLLAGTLMTHSLSGTVLEALHACTSQIKRVIVLEGRPRYEGREMARRLQALNLAVTLITDAEAAIFLPECTAVVVGADSVLANGDVINKAGTALLAWACRGYGIPFYVLCESLKISSQPWTGDLSLLEEKEPEEVLEEPTPGIEVRNFYFDRTPGELVTAIVTERGFFNKEPLSDFR
ncbi:translation initiation factor eIF-2B [Thermogemmatispora carboxidivorans]|uniref:translation initiation factor eIF-2B n=1 Tax=Thermogemmatispora carboxidivorans TaxID=1382306 RepID=UPI000699D9EC|nr:translation initiation factor eIF-2B [Thermogemmatispora carboxidivorans]